MKALPRRPDRLLMMVLVLPALLALLALAATPARAASYVFPGALPPGCSANGSNYTCSGNLALGWNDTITIAGSKPARLTINGDFSTNNAVINDAGLANELLVVVNGTLTLGYQARIKAHLIANAVNGTDASEVQITGSVTALAGDLTLGYRSTVAGTLRTETGLISTGTEVTITGAITSNTGHVSLGYRTQLSGDITTAGSLSTGTEVVIGGRVNGAAGNLSFSDTVRVQGATTTSGTIALAYRAQAAACLRSTDSAAITLGYQSTAHSVCCGAACGTACVANNSSSAMPAACSAGIVHVGSSSGDNSKLNDDKLVMSRPGSVAAGDVMIAWVTQRTDKLPLAAEMSSEPGGWTVVLTQDDGNGFGTTVYRRIAGAAEPGSYTWRFKKKGRTAGGIMVFRGVDTSTPLEASAAQLNSPASNYATPSLSTTSANTMLVALFAVPSGEIPIATPAGLSPAPADHSSGGTGGISTGMAFGVQAGAGSTGSQTSAGNVALKSVGVLLALKPAAASVPVTLPLYLRATGVPDGSLGSSAPTTTTLANHDPGRDSAAGLLLKKGGSGAAETDPTKYQRWLSTPDGLTLNGPLVLRLWSAMKNFDTSQAGRLNATLRMCSGNGTGCQPIASTSLTLAPWSGGSSTWVQRTLSFGTVNATVPSGSTLELKLVVDGSSDGDLWLAYDSTGQASVLDEALASTVHHYQVVLPASSVSCAASTVTVTACADASSPCTNAATGLSGETATLATSAGALGSTSLSFNGAGVASTTLSHPGASNGASVSLTLSGESMPASNARQCCPDGASCGNANSCATTFSTAGFLFAASGNGASTTLPAQTAGTASATYFLRAVRTGTSTQACEAALTGAQSVDWGYECLNPGSCAGSNLLQVNGGSATTVARNNSGSSASTTAVAMNFDSTGSAPFTFTHADVGQVRLHASKAAGGVTLSGSSNSLVVRPARFALGNIRQTASPNTANPGASDASGARFIAAGEAFSATVTALTSSGATAPSYGRESPAEGVLLTATLVQPSGGAAGTLSNATLAGGSFSNGAATATALSYSEVGIVALTPTVADGNYLGAGNVSGTTSGSVGRFVPARFAVSGGGVMHRSGAACSPASAFSYLGENFRLAATVTAQNSSGGTTTNYTGAYAKFDATSAAGWNLAGVSGTTSFSTANGRLALGSSSGSWAAGVLTGTITAQVTRASNPDGPHGARFGIAPADSDGVATSGLNLATAAPFSGSDRAELATVALRHGRLRLSSHIGPADRVLALPLAAQYWDGSAWAPNTLDSCTAVPVAALNFGGLSGTLTTADTAAASGTSSIALSQGRGQLRLAAPGGGRRGSYSVALSLGSSATDASCLQPWSPGSGDGASAGAQLAYLRGAWCGSASDKDPAARASFGRASGAEHLVFRQENP